MFGFELVKLCCAQDLIICNGLKKWPNSSQMTYIHGLGSSVVNYVIFYIPLYNEIIIFDILKDHEPESDHRPLTVTLNFVMHRDPIEDNPHSQKNLIFDRNKNNFFLNELKINLLPLSSINNIEDLYHNLTQPSHILLTSSQLKFQVIKEIAKPTLCMIKIVKVRRDKLRKLLMSLLKLTR